MRSLTPALLIALLMATAATAQASSPSDLKINGPGERVMLSSGVPQNVTLFVDLTLEHFTCFEDTPFPVHLGARGNETVNATLEADQVVFLVPEGSYLNDPYHGRARVTMTLLGHAPENATNVTHAKVQAAAAFPGGDSPCVEPSGFDPSAALLVLDVAIVPPPQPGANASDETNATTSASGGNATADGNETLDGNSTTEGNASAEDGGRPAPTRAGEPCPPGVTSNCGFIGEFNGSVAESTKSPVPAPGLLAVAAVGMVAALALRRRG